MEEKDYLKDISEIKDLMNRSSQFISLSGISGILAGVYALIGAFIAKMLLAAQESHYIAQESDTFRLMMLTAFSVLMLSIATAATMSYFKAKKQGEKIWNNVSKRLAINFMIPLVTGGIFGLLLLRNEFYGLIAPVTLLFYGLSCVNASKYTFRDIRYLGITVIVLGLMATGYPGYALEFWALGFGFCHIIYGTIMHFKYDRK